jgi:hypothetical protein
MMAGAPPLITNSVPGKRRRMSWKNSRQFALSSLVPGARCKQRLLAVPQNAPGCQHRPARLSQMQPLGNAVDKQVGDSKLRQVAAGEPLIPTAAW